MMNLFNDASRDRYSVFLGAFFIALVRGCMYGRKEERSGESGRYPGSV